MIDFDSVPDVLTLSDLQNVLQIGRSTAYRLVNSKKYALSALGKASGYQENMCKNLLKTKIVLLMIKLPFMICTSNAVWTV